MSLAQLKSLSDLRCLTLQLPSTVDFGSASFSSTLIKRIEIPKPIYSFTPNEIMDRFKTAMLLLTPSLLLTLVSSMNPSVSKIEPTTGSYMGGTRIYIFGQGTNLKAMNAVYIYILNSGIFICILQVFQLKKASTLLGVSPKWETGYIS